MVATLLHQRLGMPPTVLDQPELVVAQGSLAAVPAPGVGPQPATTTPFPVATRPDSAPPAYAPTAEHAQSPYGQPPYGQPGYGQQPGYAQPAAHQRPMSPAAAGFGPPPAGPVWPPSGGATPPAKRRRGPARILAVLAAVVLAVVAGGVALANLGEEDTPGTNTSQGDKIDVRPPSGDLSDAPATQPAETPTEAPVEPGGAAGTTPPVGGAAGPRIKYEILVAKRTKATTLSYHDKDGDTISYQGHTLPWELEFVAADPNFDPSVTAQINGGTGLFVTCRLTIDGKLRTERTDTGKLYPTVIC
jgi:hypothetical protein